MKISTSLAVVALALPLYSFMQLPANKPGKIEMRISFPFIKKNFSACKDSSLMARVVIFNRTDTLVSFASDAGTGTPANVMFEIVTGTSAYVVEIKDRSSDAYKLLFPGDSVVFMCLLTSQSCQPTQYSRRIPKPGEGLKSIRAIFQYAENENNDLKMASYNDEEPTVQPLTAPDANKQRNAVRRDETRNSQSEVYRSVYKGSLRSNLVKF